MSRAAPRLSGHSSLPAVQTRKCTRSGGVRSPQCKHLKHGTMALPDNAETWGASSAGRQTDMEARRGVQPSQTCKVDCPLEVISDGVWRDLLRVPAVRAIVLVQTTTSRPGMGLEVRSPAKRHRRIAAIRKQITITVGRSAIERQQSSQACR